MSSRKSQFLTSAVLGILLASPFAVGQGFAAAKYTVQAGDTLYLIAKRNGTTVSELQSWNGLGGTDVYPGQRLVIPTSTKGGGNGSGSGTSYTVKSGDTLFLIAQKFGVTVDSIRQANNVWDNSLYAGEVLTIPGGSGSSGSGTTYTVKSGDTLFLIAQRFGVTVDSIRSANNVWDNSLYVGETLTIPGASGGSGGSSGGGSGTSGSLSQSDIDLLARLVSAEAGGESYSGQVAVAAVVLTRLRDSRYPKTIPGIVYEYSWGAYQFTPVQDGRINLPAVASAYSAIQDALNGQDPSGGANGFYNPAAAEPGNWVMSQPVTAVIGNHVFFRS